MIHKPAMGLAALVMSCAMIRVAFAADPLPAQTQLVAAATAPAATQQSFTIATSEDLVVTLTDLQIPSPLQSANVVVTQAGAIAASAQLAAPATTASASLPAASGNYTIYVFGAPNSSTSVGTFSVCVAPKATPSDCIEDLQNASQSPSFSGNISAQGAASDPTVSTLSTTLNVTVAGSYTFNFSDLTFPVALNSPPNLALFQGGSAIIPPGQTTPAITAGSSLTLNPGTYNLLAIAQADQTVQSGLYAIVISAPDGSALVNTAVPVGLLRSGTPFSNPVAQSVTLTVTDYGFPGPLASASALLTAGGTVVGTANSAGGAQSFAAPLGPLNLWTYASPGTTAGTYSADVSGATDLYTTAAGTAPAGSNFAYAYVVPVTAAGAYQAAAADLQFPAQLTGLAFAVAQGGLILKQSATAASLNFNAVAGNVVLLASAQSPASGSTIASGLFDINLQTAGASAQLVFDKTQSVSSSTVLFDAQTLTIAADASFDVVLTDLKFPAAFDNLALVVSRGSNVLGKIFGGGPFSFVGTPGTYQLTFVATPAADQQYGLYATSVVFSPPAITLTSSVATATTGTSIQLNWNSTNADSCTASGGTWLGDKATTASSESVVLGMTTTYVLSCTGPGGTASQSVTVTATAAPRSGGGGGGLDFALISLLSAVLATRFHPGARRIADQRTG